MAKIIMARAPVRNADLGGWRDTRLFSSGKVLNMAIRLYTYVSLTPMGESGYVIESHDIGGSEHVRNLREMEYAGALGLLKAAIGSAGAAGGLKLIVRSEAPPASGLGSSAALAVATLGALYRYEGRLLLEYDDAGIIVVPDVLQSPEDLCPQIVILGIANVRTVQGDPREGIFLFINYVFQFHHSLLS